MSFGSFNSQRQQSMMSDINVTPMVDVMLVLLIIFIISAPMMTTAVKLDLPSARAQVSPTPAETVSIAIDAAALVYWNGQQVDAAALAQHMAQAAKAGAQPELHLRADRATRYEVVAQVMAAAQQHGLNKIGFVTEPPKESSNGKR